MKILSGKLKGRNFYMPAKISPTQNLVRKAIFDILGDIKGVNFLELFAGSGAVGLEAFSRGAKTVTLIERDPQCLEVIHENLRLLDIVHSHGNHGCHKEIASSQKALLAMTQTADPLIVIPAEVFLSLKQLALKNKKYDIVFLDPPFGRGLGKKALKALCAYDILTPNCFLLIQGEKNEILPAQEGRFYLIREKKYGASRLSVYEGRAS